MKARGLIILDRDGVLNRIVVHPEHGTINSPMNISEVEVLPWVPTTLKQLQDLGFKLVIASNQPAAHKGSTTKGNLIAVHETILRDVQSQGAVISESYICYHQAEDKCECRKPQPGLLRRALADFSEAARGEVWMVGDGVTDIEAGQILKMKTAFLGPKKCDGYRVMEDRNLSPTYWGSDLRDFVAYLER